MITEQTGKFKKTVATMLAAGTVLEEDASKKTTNELLSKYNKKTLGHEDPDYEPYKRNDYVREIAKKIQSRIKFSDSDYFKKGAEFISWDPIPRFMYSGYHNKESSIEGYTLARSLRIWDAGNTHKYFEITFYNVHDRVRDWTNSTYATIKSEDGYIPEKKVSQKDFVFFKKIAKEIQKEIIKDRDYRILNMRRKIEQTEIPVDGRIADDNFLRFYKLRKIREKEQKPDLYEGYFPY